MVIAFPVLVVIYPVGSAGRRPACLRDGAAAWARTDGAPALTTLFEVRFGVMAAVFNGFGRVCRSRLRDHGRRQYRRPHPQHSDGLALETSKGEFAQGIALGSC